MSIRIQTEVWKHSRAKGTELLLLLAIADNADEDSRQAFPAVRSLATKCRISERSVQRCIGRLAALGELEIGEEFAPSGRQRRNTYTISKFEGDKLSPPKGEYLSPPINPDVTGRVPNLSPTRVPPMSPGRVTAVSPHINHHIEPSYEPSCETLSANADVRPAKQNHTEARTILQFLNAKTGRRYREVDVNLKLIEAILKSGVSVQDMKTVTMRKINDWKKDPKMSDYLRPSTLYRRSNFENYLGQTITEDEHGRL